MEHLDDLLVFHKIGKRRKIVDSERVDCNGFIGRGRLNKAKTGMKRLLAQELRIDGDGGISRRTIAKSGQFLICGYIHNDLTNESSSTPHGVGYRHCILYSLAFR